MQYLDYNGPEAPTDIKQYLARHGKNPAGKPLYRFVLAAKVLEKKGQEWHDWDDNIPIELRKQFSSFCDQFGRPLPSPFKPTRVVKEIREVQKYPHFDGLGWILERWMPAAYFGSDVAWNSAERCVPGTSIPMLGPYPYEGQYEHVGGPCIKPPSLGFLEDSIAWLERDPEKVANRVEDCVRIRVQQAVDKQLKAEEALAAESAYRIQEAIGSLATSTSLAAGRWRSRAAERQGITSHMGN